MVWILLYLFIIGLFVGSFYNVVALRLCKNESIVFPGSHCVNCNHKLSWYELIPVFSYIGLRGRCHHCKKHISLQYPLIELLTGILFALSFYIFGFSYNTLISIVLCSIVIITYITDSKYMVILDEVLVVGSILILLIYLIFEGIVPSLWYLFDALIVFLIMVLVKFLGDFAFKQESLGWGDVKLSFIAGLVLGINLGIAYIVLGSFLAFPYALYISIKKKDSILPFGPFLATSLLIIFWNYSAISSFFMTLLGVV